MARRRAAKTVDELLAQARATLPDCPRLPRHFTPEPAAPCSSTSAKTTSGARTGLIPGALVPPCNSLEWRRDPASGVEAPRDHRRRDLRIILACNQGYQSSLAAAHPAATLASSTRHRPGRVRISPPGPQPTWLPVIAPATASQPPGNRHQQGRAAECAEACCASADENGWLICAQAA